MNTLTEPLSKWGKWYRQSYPRSPLTDDQVRLLDVFQGVATGLYNIPVTGRTRFDGGFRSCWKGIEIRIRFGEFATFDSSELTHLVVNAHRMSARVSISADRGGLLVVRVYPRTDTGEIGGRHRTLGQLAEMVAEAAGESGTSGYPGGEG